jgi:transcription elongation factor GreA
MAKANEIYVSRIGYDKMVEELDHLKKVKKPELSKAIGTARELGDLKENADYHAAKEAQAFNEKRIAELQDKLTRCRILDYENVPPDQALIGATVTLINIETHDEYVYTLVSSEETDFATGKISVDSLVGKGLLGHKVNEAVEVTVPAGKIKYKITKIERKE